MSPKTLLGKWYKYLKKEIMRKVLITGGTGSIGSELVKSMVNDGHSVLFTTRSKEAGRKLINQFRLPENRCIPIELDFSDSNGLKKLDQQLDFLPDAVIHNARSLDTLRIDERGRVENTQFQQEFFNGITFPYQITNLLLDKNTPLKDVIFISSMYGVVAPSPDLYENFNKQSPINYGVVKAAQIHMVKELAVRLAPLGIRSNAISYGGVEGRVDEAFKNRYAKLAPSGRMLKNTDLYPPVAYLLNNKDLNMTGENLKVDGGWTIW